MSYEYSGKFLTQRDREKLHTLARSAGDQLLAIAESQQKLAKQIEDYQGYDWDDRYGSTGLWRKLYTDLYTTNLSKCQVDLCIALSAKPLHRGEMLDKVLDELNSLKQMRNTAYLQFLKARTYSLLARTDPIYEVFAEKEFDQLSFRSDMRHSTVFRIAIERIKLFGPAESHRLKKLAAEIAKSKCKDDIELVLSLACLQRWHDPEAFEKTVQTWPQIEDFLGSLALSDLANRIDEGQLTKQYLHQISIFEAELAAQAAWKNKTKEYKTLLGRLLDAEKFQTPLILYVAAIAFADSSPAEAVNLLIKASTLQSAIGGQKSNKLNIEAHEIARQAAQLAYGFYNQAPVYCRLVIEAFENYRTIAAEKIDEETEYLYTVILNDCGQAEKSTLLLDRIAGRPAGRWRNRAKLGLITAAIRQRRSESREKHSELLKQLDDLITDCRRDEDDSRLRMEVITVYCRLLLETKDKASAQKVLDVLTDVEIAIDPNLSALKSNALRQLGRLDESAECLCELVNSNSDKYAEAMELLSEIIDKIDYYQAKLDSFPKMLKDCYKLACYCRDCAGPGDSQRAALMAAEITVFATAKRSEELSRVDKLLNDLGRDTSGNNVHLLRCRARLLTAQGKFDRAVRLWARIANIRKNGSRERARRTWKWWRAKFYELDCFAKIPQTEKKDILHTIEVLENSFTDIPPLWAEKLNLLKQRCELPREKKKIKS